MQLNRCTSFASEIVFYFLVVSLVKCIHDSIQKYKQDRLAVIVLMPQYCVLNELLRAVWGLDSFLVLNFHGMMILFGVWNNTCRSIESRCAFCIFCETLLTTWKLFFIYIFKMDAAGQRLCISSYSTYMCVSFCTWPNINQIILWFGNLVAL